MQPPDEGRDSAGRASPGPVMTIDQLFVRDDLDAAMRFFAAAGREPPTDAERASPDATMLDLSRFRARRIRERLLSLIDLLLVAIAHRDVQAVWDILDETDALRCFPAVVREEALRIVHLPLASERPPLHLYRYQYTLAQLGDEPVEQGADPDQIAIPLPATPVREPPRTLRFPDPPVGDAPARSSASEPAWRSGSPRGR